MRQHPNLRLADDAYLQVVVAYNAAIGGILGFDIVTAEDFDRARQRLSLCDWLSLAPQFAEQHPEPCRLWDEVCQDILESEEYRFRVRIATEHLRPQLRAAAIEPEALYLGCLHRVTRRVIGRAAVWPVTLAVYRARKPHRQTTWLAFALHGSRDEMVRGAREMLGLSVRGTPAEDGPNFVPLEDHDVAARGRSASEIAEANEQIRRVNEAVGRLSAEHRGILALRQQGLTFGGIAEVSGCTTARVRQLYSEALASLGRELGDSFGQA